MAKRNWVMKWSYGYAGTNNQEAVDACDELGISEEQLESMTDEEVESMLTDICWEMAVQQVEAYVE